MHERPSDCPIIDIAAIGMKIQTELSVTAVISLKIMTS